MANGAPTVSNGLVISGVTTSTTFSGSGASLTNLPAAQLTGALPAIDGSNLTNITSTTINNNGSNRIITGSSTANTLEGESTFTYNGTHIAKIDTSQTYAMLQLDGSSSGGGAIEFYADGTRKYELYGLDAEVALYDREKGAYHTKFKSGGNVEISDGKLLIGTTTEGVSNADDLTIATSSDTGITIRSGSSSSGRLFFSDGTSGTDEYTGGFEYAHNDNSMRFFTNGGSERVRIDSNGDLGLGIAAVPQDSGARTLHIHDTDTGSGARAAIRLTHGSSGSSASNGAFIGFDNNPDFYIYNQEAGNLRFGTNGTERMRVDSNGQVTKPNQVSFAAYVGSNAYGLHNQIFPFNNTKHNIGNHFNTSNYRFTAPVAGRYLFNFHSIFQTNGQHDIQIRVNNSSGSGMMFHVSQNGTNWDLASCSYMLNLNANDYVTMFSVSNTGWHGNNWGMFSGELLS